MYYRITLLCVFMRFFYSTNFQLHVYKMCYGDHARANNFTPLLACEGPVPPDERTGISEKVTKVAQPM